MSSHLTAPPAGAEPESPRGDVLGPESAVRRAALVAGIALLVMSVLAGFGSLVAVQGLVTSGNAARTAADITASAGLFRLGVASLYLVVVLDVVVAWALMRVLSPVDRELARLSAWFRLAYAGVFLVAVSQLAGIPQLLSTADHVAFPGGQLAAQALVRIDTFHDIWFAGLVLFAVHLALVGVLAYRSTYVPRVLGVLLVVAGAGYALDTFVSLFTADPPFTVATVTFVGELLLAVWLVVRGRRISLPAARHD